MTNPARRPTGAVLTGVVEEEADSGGGETALGGRHVSFARARFPIGAQHAPPAQPANGHARRRLARGRGDSARRDRVDGPLVAGP